MKVNASIAIDTQGVIRKANKIKLFINLYKEYISDSVVLKSSIVCRINFVTLPRQLMLPRPLPLRREEMAALQRLVKGFSAIA